MYSIFLFFFFSFSNQNGQYVKIDDNIDNNQTQSELCSFFCDETGGKCINGNKCECKDDYISFVNDHKNVKFCGYHQHKKMNCALLELFIGFGIGHIYSERLVNGYFKFCFCFLFCFCSCCCITTTTRAEYESEEIQQASMKISVIISIILISIDFIWNTIDCICFLNGFYLDGNNIQLN